MGSSGWTAVLPVKHLTVAKSRLRGTLGHDQHEALALALARDTLQAVRDCPEVSDVVVVTGDPRVAAAATAAGAQVVPEPAAGGLNAAVDAGAARATRPGRWLAALTADLPALQPRELSAALRAAASGPVRRRYLTDAPGTGTVLLTAPPGVVLQPRFGPGSAAAHAASGAVELTGDWPGLRRDVDTADDLRAAAALGLGRHTGALLAGVRPAGV